ncbi:hypothetical protein OUZ56_032918 [Daphnia magna]|uniref:Uncharacterized protein n=1 Tax=Daphnia magna TaxID=35525 RepID=A0ABQ9ZX70_9CRUS|nr:hypothetical protein OUZ56_032918 [Daphnia magna]
MADGVWWFIGGLSAILAKEGVGGVGMLTMVTGALVTRPGFTWGPISMSRRSNWGGASQLQGLKYLQYGMLSPKSEPNPKKRKAKVMDTPTPDRIPKFRSQYQTLAMNEMCLSCPGWTRTVSTCCSPEIFVTLPIWMYDSISPIILEAPKWCEVIVGCKCRIIPGELSISSDAASMRRRPWVATLGLTGNTRCEARFEGDVLWGTFQH